MSKIILIPNSIEDICNLRDKVDGFIIPIKDLSINYEATFTTKEFKEIYNEIKDKDIFISLNKNMHNKDLDYLKNILKELDDYDIKGIIYYDVALINLKKEGFTKHDLVWGADHMVSNYATINFWNKEGAKYAYLASEITKNEILDIKKNTDSILMMNIFGYVPIFTSKRNLITNYLETFNKEKISNLYYMYKEGIYYPVYENDGTVAYSGYVLNGLKEYYDLDLDYYVINSFLIDDISKVLDIFNKIDKNNLEKCYQELNKIIGNTSDGFLHKETIYKVK